MITYTVEEVIEDIFAFENVKINLDIERINSTKENKFCTLYSEVYPEPLDKGFKEQQLKERINNFVKCSLLPEIVGEIPVEGDFLLCAGYQGLPLEIIVCTSDSDIFKARSKEVIENESTYTVISCAFVGHGVSFYKRKGLN